MTASFKYNLSDFKAYSTEQAQNVVKSVRFEIVCEHMGQTQRSFQPIEFNTPDFNNFTEFKDLTQEMILAWVTEQLGQEEIDALKFGMESFIEQEIERRGVQPVVNSISAPWL